MKYTGITALFALVLCSLCVTLTDSVRAAGLPPFLVLPDYVATPDGMAVCPTTGDLVVACPNFGDDKRPACVVRIDKQGNVRKWFDVPILAETGKAFPMGIAFGPDGSLFLCDNQNWPTGNGVKGELAQGRLLRVKLDGNRIVGTTVVVSGIPHPNGVRIRDGFAYVTVSCLPKIHAENGLLYSGVYRYPITAEGIVFDSSLNDPYLYVALQTKNSDCQYGVDGLLFDASGNLIVGNFGDGTLLKVVPGPNGKATTEVYAQCNPIPPLNGADGKCDPDFLKKATRIPMRTTDGMCLDPKTGDIYVADFSNNAIARVNAGDRTISFLAISPDSNGLGGQLNQPGEPCLWNGRLAVTCFDMVTGPDKVNTKHDPRATIVFLPLK